MEGSIECDVTSGDVEIRDFLGDVTIQSTSGDIAVGDGVGMLRLKSTSGEIDGDNVELKGNSEFRANSGDISVNFANGLNELSFDLQTNSGDLRVGDRSSDKTLYMKEGDIWVRGITTSGSQRFRD